MSIRRPREARYFARTFGVVVSASVVHFTLAHLILGLLAEGDRDWLLSGPRAALSIIVGATALVSMATYYVRSQYAGPDEVARSVPLALRLTPPIAAGLAIPLVYDPALLTAISGAIVRNVAPTLTAAWSTAFMVSILLKRMLFALAIRTPRGNLESMAPPAPSTVAGGYARILSGAAFSTTLLAVGVIATRLDLQGLTADAPTIAAAAGLPLMVLVAALAGASLGQTPGRDVVSIARRLDALGYNARQTMEWPVVVTNLDEVGELFARLEQLRLRLAREVAVYEEALDRTRDADHAKAEFLGAVSHELRTPLNSVCGFAQLLLERGLSEAQSEDVRLIRAGGNQLLGLINDILDISMIESGELRLRFESVDIGEVVEEIVLIHQPLVRGVEVKLLASVASNLPEVICDRRRIGQILTNLVSNAIKFTEEGSITVTASQDPRGDRVILRVSDTGVGIAEDELDTIFEEYRQVGSVKRRTKGTGLGLAIARSIAMHHGGALTCESILGEGSAFILSLPRNPPRRPSAIDVTQEAARAVERAKRRTGETPVAGGAQ